VLVIGLDGATFDVVDSLLAEGVLPNLAALRDRGTTAVLETVLPAMSPPAWTSATTGVNPGKHNIYDFFHLSKTGPQALLTSSLDRRARPVWYFLNAAGYRTGLMNIPMTFPPDRVDGFFISGFPYGAATTGFTYPAELEKEIGEYPLDLFGESLPRGNEGLLLGHFRHTFARQATVAEDLIQKKDWDLFWVVFTGTDKVQHFFWKYADPKNPEYDAVGAAQFGDAIRDMFIRMDKVIGELVARAGPNTDVIVMSDHGFSPIREELRLQNWLRAEGFIAQDSSGAFTKVDAFPPGPFGGLLRVSQEGRDFGGQIAPGAATEEVRRRLAEKLAKLVDPRTGLAFAQHVYRREELYHGPYVDNGPDLVFVEAPTLFVGRGSPADTAVFGPPSYTFSGFHRPEGVFFAAGPRFRHDPQRQHASILGVTPTLYWLFDVPAPKDLDGELFTTLVRPDSLARRPARVGDGTAVVPPSDVAAPSEKDREVLKSLGYVQ
jgi:predicted AlkP superfamily phosphohydrolase/phosphomutase